MISQLGASLLGVETIFNMSPPSERRERKKG